jgi:peptide/nickel transport system ATP-binding protein
MRLIPNPPGKIAGGSITFDGENLLDYSEDEMRHVRGNRIAMIFQDPMTSLNPVLTIGRQLTESLELHMKLTGREAETRAIELLNMVGIPSAARRLGDYPHQFSGGMRQRVMIAMGLSCNPELLIADEPTTALDVTIQAQILDLIDGLRRDLKMAVILITHDLGVIAEACDRVAVMYAGRIVEVGPVQQVIHQPSHPYTAGLMGSIPSMEIERERLLQIDGAMPRLNAIPKGCAFHPRCTQAFERCRRERPDLMPAPATLAACWLIDREQAAR